VRTGQLDRQVRFQRADLVDDGFSSVEVWEDEDGPLWHGEPVWAQKTDVSDGEKWRAGEVAATITTRFVVRWSSFSSGLTPKDRLFCEGQTYDITGIKEVGGRRRWLEITASARDDLE